MDAEAVADLVDRQEWTGSLADAVAALVHQAYAAAGATGKRVEDILHGVWLGHPLYPVLTDLPLGA
ncbi:MAG: hypothetical protein IT208_14455 [Chthonomonadales bacterium]|nr:hypothetical protein [Chthonomonadales bacterium]